MTNEEFEPVRRRIMQEAYDLAERDSEAYNAIKVMCGDVQRMLPDHSGLVDEYEKLANQAIFNNDFKNRLAQAIEQMPFGDTAASFAQFVRDFK